MKLLDYIFPPKCPFCREILTSTLPLCKNCADIIKYTDGKVCEICSVPLSEFSYRLCATCHRDKMHFTKNFVPLVYTGKAQHAIISLKYYSHPSFSNAFAFLIADKLLKEAPETVKFDFVTFVPQSKKTFFNRGYNQAELIAKRLAKILNIPCKSTLERKDDSVRQATLNAAQRRKNASVSYFSKGNGLTGTALLVDDVYTTGATANRCSLLLKKSGCSEVYVATALIRGDIYA